MISLSKLIVEGRYDSLTRELSNKLLQTVKDSFVATQDPAGLFAGDKIYFKKGDHVPPIDPINKNDKSYPYTYFEEVENETIPIDCYLSLKIQWVEDLGELRYGGDAFNENERKHKATTPPMIEVRLEIDPEDYPNNLSTISMHLKDILRHELEHTTQSGWNEKETKYLRGDQAMRDRIQTGKKPAWNYFVLKKEIPAMIQGLYFKAKKSKLPFAEVVNEYLDDWIANGTITEKEKQKVLKIWRSYLPQLAIRQEL